MADLTVKTLLKRPDLLEKVLLRIEEEYKESIQVNDWVEVLSGKRAGEQHEVFGVDVDRDLVYLDSSFFEDKSNLKKIEKPDGRPSSYIPEEGEEVLVRVKVVDFTNDGAYCVSSEEHHFWVPYRDISKLGSTKP